MIQCINCLGEASAEHYPVASQPNAPRLWMIEVLPTPRVGACVVPPAPRRASVVWTPQKGNGLVLARSLQDIGTSARDVLLFHGDVRNARAAAKQATCQGLIAGTAEF